jgi:hypothetical protein
MEASVTLSSGKLSAPDGFTSSSAAYKKGLTPRMSFRLPGVDQGGVGAELPASSLTVRSRLVVAGTIWAFNAALTW